MLGKMKVAIIGLLALAVSLPGGAMAQRVGEKFGDWVVECTALGANQTVCSISQTLISAQTRQTLVKFTLGRVSENNAVTLVALVPLGIDLTRPVTGSIDANPGFTYTMETCVQRGCVATFPLGPAQILGLKNGGKLNIKFTMRGAEQEAVLTGSLSGITAGIAAIGLE